MNNFLENFLKISTVPTLISIIFLLFGVIIMKVLKDKKVSFSSRMMIALVIGVIIGVGIDLIYGNNAIYNEIARKQISLWYGLLGGTFVRLIQLMAIPVVFLSLFFVILDFEGKNIKGFTFKTLLMLLGTTAIAAFLGILVVNIFGLTKNPLNGAISESMTERISGISSSSFPEYFGNLVPSNIAQAFSSNGGIISVAIISALFATSAKFLMSKGKQEIIPVIEFLRGFNKLINSVLINIIKIMPYAIIALVSSTIISNGIESIKSLFSFIVALYIAVILQLVVYSIILILFGLNPIQFYKNAFPTMIFAFSSRSSVGTLPHTLNTLKNRMGVSDKTANFIGPLSTTVGSNGCAGVFPAMLGVLVAASAGVTINFPFYVLLVIVVTLGSIGIAGVPGTATVAATVTLNGIGLGHYFDRIGLIFGIDPIIDMGRTMLNVTGGMVSAVIVDRWEKTHNIEIFNSTNTEINE
ncbi:cation:dicarboxylase symporter family transporter [Helcococcus bovis]|uniref:cation:dicarboxylate symporter family transporter n=1 Tax=Helcococcus bovis TaxID=3153252 RepID=UPI0038B792D1